MYHLLHVTQKLSLQSETYVVLLKAILNVWPFSQLSPSSFVLTNKFVFTSKTYRLDLYKILDFF